MKVQIIYLDPHDDHVSARDKLNWAQTPSVALVWPKDSRILSNPLDLALLQQHGRLLGKQLALVTQDREVCRNAQELGIPVVDSLSELPDEGWPKPFPPTPSLPPGQLETWEGGELALQPPLNAPRKSTLAGQFFRWLSFIAAIASVIALATVLFHTAEVIILPETTRREAQLTLRLDPNSSSPTATGLVPARTLKVRMFGEMRQPTSGEVAVPSSPAQGTVVFTNLSSDPLEIPEGTGLRAAGRADLRFVTLRPIELPGRVGASASVQARAQAPGSAGNVSPGEINAVEGLLGLQVSATNPEPMIGGADEMHAGVSPDDIQSLEARLTQQLLQRARDTISETLDQDEVLRQGLLGVSQIFAREFDHEPGDASETLSLSLDLQVSAIVYRQSDCETAALMLVQRDLAGNQQPVPDSLELTTLSDPTLPKRGLPNLSFRAQYDWFEPVDGWGIARSLTGKSPQQARSILKDKFNLSTKEIRLTPAWMPWLPWISSHITLQYPWQAR